MILSITAADFNKPVTEEERTEAQLQIISEALQKAKNEYVATGKKTKQITVTDIRMNDLTEETICMVRSAGFRIYNDSTVYVNILIPAK